MIKNVFILRKMGLSPLKKVLATFFEVQSLRKQVINYYCWSQRCKIYYQRVQLVSSHIITLKLSVITHTLEKTAFVSNLLENQNVFLDSCDFRTCLKYEAWKIPQNQYVQLNLDCKFNTCTLFQKSS